MAERDLLSLYLKDIRQYKTLEKEEELELVIKAQSGDEEAKNQLILCNLRLVVNVAKGYRSKGMNLIDLISEGNLGLIRAIEKFDVEKGFRFSTYAVWWIKQSISKAIIFKGREIRIPSYRYDILNKINRYVTEEIKLCGVYPSVEEVAEYLNMPVNKVEEIMIEFQEPMSLSTEIGDDIYLEDTLSGTEEHFEEKVYYKMMQQRLKDILNRLDTREQEILKLRFGLDGYEIHTLEEIGKNFNITRERVRQIEKNTLKKLKRKYTKELRETLL
ncbi:MAG: sigma-70 family RNA polymerase sigma factor [Fusobacterium necrophorum]|nr:sigma-70 family RNA polymerase sigma factor [Fusobacterium necrophorum]MCI7680812.1 sigma-70 family RNA polymerase sigma factor [Fusobacterium necrophorum]MDY2572473.1 sigma-70 family RNA polymerase sigma factor [Fusobacterium necrophorum]MDY6171910.1 sigma-70 family RNA polymerase sigma factor [Fusobacterium necrophorum]